MPFRITPEDVVIPFRCPVYGCVLRLEAPRNDHSPTIDKYIPGLGYIPGNIRVISYRANRHKNDASPEEIERLWRDAQRFGSRGFKV